MPKQKAAITSVAKCTIKIILLRPIAIVHNNNRKEIVYFLKDEMFVFHKRYARILQKIKEETEWPLGKLYPTIVLTSAESDSVFFIK